MIASLTKKNPLLSEWGRWGEDNIVVQGASECPWIMYDGGGGIFNMSVEGSVWNAVRETKHREIFNILAVDVKRSFRESI